MSDAGEAGSPAPFPKKGITGSPASSLGHAGSPAPSAGGNRKSHLSGKTEGKPEVPPPEGAESQHWNRGGRDQ